MTYRINYKGNSKVIKRICDRINDLPGLGTQHHTAFYGDWGQEAYEHSQTTGNPHGLTLEELGIGNIVSQVTALIMASGNMDKWIVSVTGEDDSDVWDDTDDELLFAFIEDALIWS